MNHEWNNGQVCKIRTHESKLGVFVGILHAL